MNITYRLLELYKAGVSSGLDVKLHLWSRDGHEFFSFTRLPGHRQKETYSSTQKRRWRRERYLTPENVKTNQVIDKEQGPTLDDVRSPLKEQRPTLDEVRSPLKEQRPTLDDVRSPLKEQRPTPLDEVRSPLKEQRPTLKGDRPSLDEERRPWKEGRRRKPKKDVCPPKIGTIVKYLEPIPQLDGGCTPDIDVPTPGTPFPTEPELKLDKLEQEPDPKPPLPPPNLINPIFGYCQDKNCFLCPTKSTVKIGEFFTCFPQKDDSRTSCQLIHWHSKNNHCLQATADELK